VAWWLRITTTFLDDDEDHELVLDRFQEPLSIANQSHIAESMRVIVTKPQHKSHNGGCVSTGPTKTDVKKNLVVKSWQSESEVSIVQLIGKNSGRVAEALNIVFLKSRILESGFFEALDKCLACAHIFDPWNGWSGFGFIVSRFRDVVWIMPWLERFTGRWRSARWVHVHFRRFSGWGINQLVETFGNVDVEIIL
jgi:hypothetical protein